MTIRPGREAYPLDDISKAIIEQLQQNGRRPYASIGKAVGLSIPTYERRQSHGSTIPDPFMPHR